MAANAALAAALDYPTKTKDILARKFTLLPMCNDLPRLAATISVELASGEVLYSAPRAKAADPELQPVHMLGEVLLALIPLLESYDAVQEAEEFLRSDAVAEVTPALLPKALEQYFGQMLDGDQSRLVRLLKAINQASIAPAVMALKFALGSEHMTKDVGGSWKTRILLEPMAVVVVTTKREQCVKNHFLYEWELSIRFDRTSMTPQSVVLSVVDLMFHQDLHTSPASESKLRVWDKLGAFLSARVLAHSEIRQWDFFAPAPPPSSVQGRISYANGDEYNGEVDPQNRRHGRGLYTSPLGDIYAGEWQRGRRHGQGVFVRSDGSRYAGQFAEDLPSGMGCYVYANGDLYSGLFEGGLPHGAGRWSSRAGDYYEGNFERGLRHGYGTFVSKGSRAEGEWVHNRLSGRAQMEFGNGDKVQSQDWEDGVPSGGVRYTLADGSTVDAVWAGGHPIKRLS